MVQYIDIRNKINSQITQTKGVNKMNLSEALDKVVQRVKSRVSLEIPDTGFFRSFAENFDKCYKPEFYCKDIALFVERDLSREGRAFLGVSVLHPEMSLSAASYFINGTRDNILEYINNPNFKEELEKTVLELSESLKKQG